MPSNSIDIRWSILGDNPNIEMWYPADTPSEIVRLYHAIQNNVPNRLIVKTIARTVSAGNEYNTRNTGYDQEMWRVDVVLATKDEAREFTDFFKNIIKGPSNVFYYKNNRTGQENYVRVMDNSLKMGEAESSPYSFSILLKKERPYSGNSINLSWRILLSVSASLLAFLGYGDSSFILNPTNSLEMYACGDNSLGSLGIGDYVDRTTFNKVGSDTDWSNLAVGDGHSLALKEDGSLYVTGANSSGELGLGDTTTRNSWTKLGSDMWISIGAGFNHSAGIKSDGTLWVWGSNEDGQLNIGVKDTDPHSSPVQVGSDSDWTHVVCGQNFTFARKSNGTLWAWGDNASGKLGQNYSSDFESLLQIGSDTDWSGTIAAGAANGFAIKDDGSLYGWGWNRYGCLGIGDSINTIVFTPQRIGVDSWKSISAGSECTSGVKTAGTLWAWGDNGSGELGQGYTDILWHDTPVKIGTDTNWTLTSHGLHTVLAVNSNDEVYGWGSNSQGELGLGHTSIVTSPTRTFIPPSNTIDLRWEIDSPVFPKNTIDLRWEIEAPPGVGDEEEFIWDDLGGGAGPAPGP